MDKFLEEPHLLRKKVPLQWWWKNRDIYLRLFSVRKRRLCVVGSSVPCERVFSKAGTIHCERRSLKPKRLSKLSYVS
ncbi:hypothetical protein J437_LFUL018318 [Ladona fulva]|uniref:HAT C-terminal dimerisation domain-containing protein n=1 Tax=Ladona fulva TaxID=123851 RepID=A0A8K0KQT4_LADFU|nr:hypothetical protein J437_LFUL018318 [Ladona fulva]